MEPVNVERNTQKHYTRITLPDGTYEDFATVRGSIVFPFQKTSGIILVGGVCKEFEIVKILEEKEILSLSAAVSELLGLENRFFVSHFYYQNIPETGAPVEYLLRKKDLTGVFGPAPHSEDFEYGVLLINEYLGTDRLSVPQNRILANQFMANWENINADNRLHAVIALSCLLAGLEADPPDGAGISEFAIESCLV